MSNIKAELDPFHLKKSYSNIQVYIWKDDTEVQKTEFEESQMDGETNSRGGDL